MVDVIRIKRRPADRQPGPPMTLAASELAYNEADDVLYYGKGNDGNGRAIEIVAIGGGDALHEIEKLRNEVRKLAITIKLLKAELGL